MSKSLFEARRQISQVSALLRRDSVANAVECLHNGLRNVLSESLLKSERHEFEKLLDEAVKSVAANKKVRQDFQLILTYQPGKERELLEDLHTLLDSLQALAMDEVEKEVQRQEAAKRDRLLEGENALADGNGGKADALFGALAKEHDRDVALLVNIAEAYERAERLDDALKYLEKAVLLDADSAYIHNKRGILYRKARDFANAEKAFNDAIRITPDDPYLYFNTGRLYVDWQKWPETHASAQKALELQPDFNEARMMADYAQKRLS